MLSGERDPERAARALAARFGEVVVTLGADGALWTDGRESVRADAVPVEAVVDSTGAGDAFAAGLLAARLDGAGAGRRRWRRARGWRRGRWRSRAVGPRARRRAPPAYGSGEGVVYSTVLLRCCSSRQDGRLLNAAVRPSPPHRCGLSGAASARPPHRIRPAGSRATAPAAASSASSAAVASKSASTRSLGRITLASSAVVRPSGNS